MAGRFCVSLTCAKDNTDRATVAFVVANAALGSGQETLVFLSTEAVRLAEKVYSDDIHEEGFSPLKELMGSFLDAGGTIYVRAVDKRVHIVGGAKLVEFLSDGAPCISY
jgi:predicted peroxiredoxin